MCLRVLLACIRFLGRCPCTTCYTLKTQVPDMGTKYDQKRREHVRTDTTFIRSLIAKARKLIFEWGKLIASKAVESKLQPFSLQPLRVRHISCIYLDYFDRTLIFSSECFLNSSCGFQFQSLCDVRIRFAARIRTWCLEGAFHAHSACALR